MDLYNGKMLALHLMGKGRSAVRETEMPRPGKGEVLVKIYASAICGSEKQYYYTEDEIDMLSGHEAAGVVVDAGKSRRLREGDKVALYALKGCGACYYCRNELVQFCQSVQGVYNSAHAQYAVCSDANCIKIPGYVSFDSAVLIYGDTLGVAYRAMKSTGVKKSSYVFVIGAGPIGLGIIAYLKYIGARVIIAEPCTYRRELSLKIGADIILNPLAENIDDILKEETGGLGPEYVFECSGHPIAELSALSAVRNFGTVCFAGENYKGLTIIPSEHIIHKEINLTGAFYYSLKDVHGILEDYKNGLGVDNIVTHTYHLKQADKAFEIFMSGNAGKVIIHPWD